MRGGKPSKIGDIAAAVVNKVKTKPLSVLEDRQRKMADAARERAEMVNKHIMDYFNERIGPRYRDATIKGFQITHPKKQRPVVDAIQAYGVNLSDEVTAGNGIVLYGPSGTGKDHLLIALARRAIGKYRMKLVWHNGSDLFMRFRDAMDSHQAESSMMETYTRPTILFLSDPIPTTDFQRGILLAIIDARYRACKPTWITLNVADGKEADERLGSPVVDRLRHEALACHCDWPSFRKGRSIE